MHILNVIYLEVMLIKMIFTEKASFTAFFYICAGNTIAAAATWPRQDLMPRQQPKDK